MTRLRTDRLVAVLAAAVALLNLQTGGAVDPGAAASGAASLAAVASAATLLFRRSHPLAVVAAATAGYLVQASLAGPSVPAVLIAAAYAAGRYAGTRGALAAVGAAGVAAGFVAGVASGDRAGLAASSFAVLLLGVLAGVLVAARAARVAALVRESTAEERLRIARDLHDIVGHGIGAITLHAGAGRLALDAGATGDVRHSLTVIERAGQDVLRDVRWTVGLLRASDVAPRLADVAGLAQAARQAGLDVRCRETGALAAVRPDVQEAAYRIVQEALTNVVRHGRGDPRVELSLDVGPELVVEVSDDGTAPADGSAPTGGGHGLLGMRERAEAVGGTVVAGPATGGQGWRVVATLPGPDSARNRPGRRA
jgi:signal transduction histidine kinase